MKKICNTRHKITMHMYHTFQVCKVLGLPLPMDGWQLSLHKHLNAFFNPWMRHNIGKGWHSDTLQIHQAWGETASRFLVMRNEAVNDISSFLLQIAMSGNTPTDVVRIITPVYTSLW